MLLDWLASGIDPEKSTVYLQSLVPETSMLHIYLSMITPQNWVERDPTLKDLAKILSRYNNKEVKFELPDEVERKGYSAATKALMDSKKINELGWRANYSIEDGLFETINILKSDSMNIG